MIDILLALGYKLVPVDGKRPRTANWPARDFTAEEISHAENTYADFGVGIKLENLLDFDGDGPDAAAVVESLHLPESVAWQSARGRHELFKLTPAQAEFFATAGKIKFGDLELRTGINSQSVLPPAAGRKWLVSFEDMDPVILPDSVFEDIKSRLPKPQDNQKTTEYTPPENRRPGDVFNESVEWSDVLVPHDWSHVGGDKWCRPGKHGEISATTGYCASEVRGELFYCFSTSDEVFPVEPEKAYSKFELWACLNHGGDFRVAAAAAARSGYSPDVDNSCNEFLDDCDFPEVTKPSPDISASKEILHKYDSPEPDPTIYDFVLGKYVQDLIPYTEAYPPAILFQLLEVAGTLAGRRVCFLHGEYQFRLNGGTIVIGESGVSRKGTGLIYARVPFRDHEHEDKINNLISENTQVSGEGFIQAISNRDDHQLLVACEEFAGMLKSSKREGSNLSMIIRNAMDCKSLGIDARKNAIATMHDAYASIIGHCTLDEFIANIAMDDIHNGFLNRFQFTLSRQNSKIAFPKRVPDEIKTPVREAFSRLIGPQEFAPIVELSFSKDAEPVWEEFYYADNQDRSSLRESLAARAPAQVLRNASRIALLEGTTQVDARRLRIAMAMLKYSQDCIDYIFGDYLNDDEDELIQFIMSDKNGKSLHDINEWVARWRKAKRQTKRNLTRLVDKGIVVVKTVKTDASVGRPASRFVYAGGARK